MKRSPRGSRARSNRIFGSSEREDNEPVSDRNLCSSPRSGQRSQTSTPSDSFEGKHSYSCSFSRSSFVSISAFYVSFKYYHAPVHAQLNRNATSILRQMQSQHRDKEPSERHAQERKGCGQGHLPQLRNLSLPNRKGLTAPAKHRSFPLSFSRSLSCLVEPFNRNRHTYS